MELQNLQTNYNIAEEKYRQAAKTASLQTQDLQQNYTQLQNQCDAAELQRLHTAEITQAQLRDYQQKYKLLQSQYTQAVDRSQQIAAEEKRKSQAQLELIKTHLTHRNEIAAITESKVTALRHNFDQLRQKTASQQTEFQQQVELYTTQLTQLAIATQQIATSNRVRDIIKIKAFDLWLQRSPEAVDQILAQTLLHRVTTKINHTLRTLKAQLKEMNFKPKLSNKKKRELTLMFWNAS